MHKDKTVSCRYFSYKASKTHIELNFFFFFFFFPDVLGFFSLLEKSLLILVIYFGLTLSGVVAAITCLQTEGFHTLWSWGLQSHFIKLTANVCAQHNDCCALEYIIYWPNSCFLSFTVTVLYWCPEQQPLADDGETDALTDSSTNMSSAYQQLIQYFQSQGMRTSLVQQPQYGLNGWRLKEPEILLFYFCVLLFPLKYDCFKYEGESLKKFTWKLTSAKRHSWVLEKTTHFSCCLCRCRSTLMPQKPQHVSQVQQWEILTPGTFWGTPEKPQLLVLFVDKLFL